MVDILLFFHIFKKLQQMWLLVMLLIMQLIECGKSAGLFCKNKTHLRKLKQLMCCTALLLLHLRERKMIPQVSILFTISSGVEELNLPGTQMSI